MFTKKKVLKILNQRILHRLIEEINLRIRGAEPAEYASGRRVALEQIKRELIGKEHEAIPVTREELHEAISSVLGIKKYSDYAVFLHRKVRDFSYSINLVEDDE